MEGKCDRKVEWGWVMSDISRRYIDDVFFTSNESSETIKQILEEANGYHSNIKLSGDIGKCVTFLDLCIINSSGILSTSVYRKEAAEPYVIPFLSDHARHTFRNIIRGALVRAVRYSATLEIFDKERRHIRLMLLYNGYVLLFSFVLLERSLQLLAIRRNFLIFNSRGSSMDTTCYNQPYHHWSQTRINIVACVIS